MAMDAGEWTLEETDHISGVRTDNRLGNLRSVSGAENNKNKQIPSDNTSGTIGVHWHKRSGKWQAQIKADGKREHLGYFHNKDDAKAARLSAEARLGFHENHGRNGQ